MSLSGDLSTLELADLLQNLETHRKSGVLTLESDGGTAQLYFHEGRLALFAREGRADLVDVLVACGAIDEEALEAARKKRKRSRKSLTEVLVTSGAIALETLREIASSRLLDEGCELVASKSGAFTFTAGPIPRGLFDPEERHLALGLPAGPLLLESARREDHWRMIRERVPSDGAHFVAQGKPRKLGPERVAFAEEVLPLLDGSRSVSEVVAAFPHRRFEVYQLLADLLDEHAIRAAGAEEWVRLIDAARKSDPHRAARMLERALGANPHHIELLSHQVLVAEELGELERAVEALRMVVHLAFEGGDRGRAQAELAHARRLAPDDAAFLERAVAFAFEEGEAVEAKQIGLELVALYRRPGLHAKALALLERLHALLPDDLELLVERARSHGDCGEPAAGTQALFAHGERQLDARRDAVARDAFRAVLELDPKHAAAKAHLAAIESGTVERRRRERKARLRRGLHVAAWALAGMALLYEGLARHALAEASSFVARERMIEEGRYDEAAERFDPGSRSLSARAERLVERARAPGGSRHEGRASGAVG